MDRFLETKNQVDAIYDAIESSNMGLFHEEYVGSDDELETLLPTMDDIEDLYDDVWFF